jgi:hypothetical protein
MVKDNISTAAAKRSSVTFGRLGRPILGVGMGSSKTVDLDSLVRLSSRISKLQRFLNMINLPTFQADQLVLLLTRAYALSWLSLLEQLYEDDKKFNQ